MPNRKAITGKRVTSSRVKTRVRKTSRVSGKQVISKGSEKTQQVGQSAQRRIAELERKVVELTEGTDRLKYQLEEERATTESFANSFVWVILAKYRDLLNRCLPAGTKRRSVWEWMFEHATKFMTQTEPTRLISDVDETKPYGKWLERTRSLMSANPRRVPPFRSGCVDIIIPVFNGLDALRESVRSIREHTEPSYQVVIVDDGSDDPELQTYLTKIQGVDVFVLSNKRNLGFVESANRGFSFSGNDVVLLNSDTVVTRRWLDKLYACAYSSDAIGTVTPLSNNGTICSVPRFFENNKIPQGFTIDSFGELVEVVSHKDYPPIPTAVGFCTYIKRNVLNQVGHFDPLFNPGYSEENDFSMRALAEGYLSVLDDATFVYHKGKVSFSANADLLNKSHLRIIEKKHPGYSSMITEFTEVNPLKEIQSRTSQGLSRVYEYLDRSEGLDVASCLRFLELSNPRIGK